MRAAIIERETNETNIRVELELDGSGEYDINTGIGFYDHMLTQLAVHGMFDLKIYTQGDLDIDPHHTVEDTALALGQAFDQALDERRGLVRMGASVVPMDEALCEVIVDLSGRPYAIFTGEWTGATINTLPVTLIEHVFYSLSVGLRANLHTLIRYGRDDHHKAEALFKALGRALCQATREDPRRASAIPSSKGIL
jgi:imidazoleglycerol-phosphate dehydratase